jgi:hypothetical protein
VGFFFPAFLLIMVVKSGGNLSRGRVYAVRTFVLSLRRGFCVGGLPVNIWAVSNVEVYGGPIE